MTIYTQPQSNIFASAAPPSEIQDFVAWTRGLGIAFDETNGYPEMTGLNGLFNAFNLYIKYLEQNGFAEWRSDMEYPQGAGVRVGLVWYRAKLQNTNKPPATSQTEWELFLNASALSYQEPLYIEDNVIKIRDASTTVKGVARFATTTEVANKSNVSAAITPSNAATIAQSTDLGINQSWYNVTGSRSSGVTYTNNTGKPIQVIIIMNDAYNGGFGLVIGGTTIFNVTRDINAAGFYPVSFIVPNLSSYRFTWAGGRAVDMDSWAELR